MPPLGRVSDSDIPASAGFFHGADMEEELHEVCEAQITGAIRESMQAVADPDDFLLGDPESGLSVGCELEQ